MSTHLWLAPLDAETIKVFATAYTLSARKRGGRVSTERFLAALPDHFKFQVARLCKDAQNDCKMSVTEADLPAPKLPADWQAKICFSTCIESTLLKCTPDTNLVKFLKLLCTTASRLHCIVDLDMPIDSYLSSGRENEPTVLLPPPTQAPDRWQSHDRAGTLSVDDHLDFDVLRIIMSKADSIEVLRKAKAVCTSWRQSARLTSCDIDWLVANGISLHDLLKKGNPSPQLVLGLVTKLPACMHKRDGEGLLPLQYAAAYRMDADLVDVLRQVTAFKVPGSCAWANSAEALSIKSQLRPVRTRVDHGPIAA